MNETRTKKCIPNLFIVGAAKCGTTTLHDYLNQHEDINMSLIKEPHFMLKDFISLNEFTGTGDSEIIKNYTKNIDNYYSLFSNNKVYNGESSPGYFTFPEIFIKSIKKYKTEPRIIICLRNPVQRTYSAYLHKVRDGLENKTFKEVISNRLDIEREMTGWAWGWYYIKDSFYNEKVNLFLNTFENVKIIIFEELISNKDKVLNDLSDFFELKSNFHHIKTKKKNKTGVLKFKRLYILLKRISIFVSPLFNKDFKNKVKNSFFYKPMIDTEIEAYLKSMFEEDVKELSKTIKKDLYTLWFK